MAFPFHHDQSLTNLAIALLFSLASPASAERSADAPAAGSGVAFSALDPTTDPCLDLYQYACGSWLKTNPVPPDQSYWSREDELEERNRSVLRDILESAARAGPARSTNDQKIGDYFGSCMVDSRAICRADSRII
jgi:putative endopeptidase